MNSAKNFKEKKLHAVFAISASTFQYNRRRRQ